MPNDQNTHIVWVKELIPHDSKSHWRTDHQSHTNSQIHFSLPLRAGVTAVAAMRSIAVFPHDLSILFFLFLTLSCMCVKCAFASVHWPLHTGGELLNSSLLHPSRFCLAQALNRRSLGFLEMNRNYLPSSGWGESFHCVIPISPFDIKNAPRTQKGNIMLVSWIWLQRQNLRQVYVRPWLLSLAVLSFVSHSFHPRFSSSLLVFLYIFSFLPLFVSLHPSISPLSAALSEYSCC